MGWAAHGLVGAEGLGGAGGGPHRVEDGLLFQGSPQQEGCYEVPRPLPGVSKRGGRGPHLPSPGPSCLLASACLPHHLGLWLITRGQVVPA